MMLQGKFFEKGECHVRNHYSYFSSFVVIGFINKYSGKSNPLAFGSCLSGVGYSSRNRQESCLAY
jgi:hypothetical protein